MQEPLRTNIYYPIAANSLHLTSHQSLIMPLSDSEILVSLKSFQPLKMSSPDDFHRIFSQKTGMILKLLLLLLFEICFAQLRFLPILMKRILL